MPTNRILVSLLAGGLLLASGYSFAGERVDGEPSLTAPSPKVSWRAPSKTVVAAAQLRYSELSVHRIAAVHEANATRDVRRPKALQIGVARSAAAESQRKALPALQWHASDDGGRLARIEITSPLALGLRVGMKVTGLPGQAELRFAGSELPLGETLLVHGHEILRNTLPDGTYWTPVTDGETQTIEIWLPPDADASAVHVQAPQLSHLLTNSRRDFKIVEKIGESAACNIDTACRVAELGPAFVHAKNAVAHMVFNLFRTNGTIFGAFICTGTLLNDTVPGTQEPYFFTADHCFAGGGSSPDDPPAQNRQSVATTLNTYWNYEATGCGSGVSTPRAQLGGGADLLFNDVNTDAMLLRLRNAPPAGATFAGWDTAPMVPSSSVVAIHHPSGDAKKVSFGTHIPGRSDGYNHAAGWLQGTTEGGSSGSGLFTLDADGQYRLRGGLYGGNASCANSGSLANPQNIDWYSRLDVVYPQIRRYLAPQPIRRNGARPLLPR